MISNSGNKATLASTFNEDTCYEFLEKLEKIKASLDQRACDLVKKPLPVMRVKQDGMSELHRILYLRLVMQKN